MSTSSAEAPYFTVPLGSIEKVDGGLWRARFHIPTGDALLEVKSAKGVGTVKALRAITNNVDYGGDRIRAGAFKKINALTKAGDLRWPAMAWSHQIMMLPTGKVRDMEEWMPGDKRLPQNLLDQGYGAQWVFSEYDLDTQLGHDVFSLVSKEMLEESSFMFWPSVVEFIKPDEREDPNHYQDIKEIGDIVEFSDVFKGMNPLTTNLAVKARQFFSFPAGTSPVLGKIVDALFEAALTKDSKTDTKDESVVQHLHDAALAAGARCKDHEETSSSNGEPPLASVPVLEADTVAMALGAGINAGIVGTRTMTRGGK